jgi:hypothetical protein
MPVDVAGNGTEGKQQDKSLLVLFFRSERLLPS